MEKEYLNYFEKYIGKGEKAINATPEIIKKYKKFFRVNDESDLIIDIWEKHGFASYMGGRFSFVNPDEYNEVARRFPNISKTAVVFAKTCMGGLLLFDDLSIGKSVLYLNVHKGIREIVSTDFETMLGIRISAESYWKRNLYGKFELKVIEKYGSIAYDECYAFVPALALGGSESIKNIQKVKVKEHLEFLSQLY